MARRCTYCRERFIPEGKGRRCNTCGAPEPARQKPCHQPRPVAKRAPDGEPGLFWYSVAVLMAILTIFLPSDMSRWVRSLPA